MFEENSYYTSLSNPEQKVIIILPLLLTYSSKLVKTLWYCLLILSMKLFAWFDIFYFFVFIKMNSIFIRL